MLESDPVSFLLRRILQDPATNKLLTFAFSLVLVISCAANVRRDWNLVPLLVVFGSSLIYSAFALLITVFKQQEKVTNCGILKKIFRGRAIFWHEIQTTAAVTFALANISGIVLSGTSYEPTIQVIFSSLNIVFFTLEWYFAAEKSKAFVTEENPKLGHNCLDCILGGTHAFPLFFNIARKGFLIAALVLVATNSDFGYNFSYYIFFIAFAIAGSFALLVLQTSGSLENAISTKLVSGRKWHTYLMLIVVIHCFLAVLTFSLIVDTKETYQSKQESMRVYNYNSNYSNYYNNYGGYYDRDYYRRNYYTTRRYYNGYFGASPSPPPPFYPTYRDDVYRKYGIGRYNNTQPSTGPTTAETESTTPLYRTTWYTNTWWEYTVFNAPIESPIAFVLSCVAMVLALLDLYARAIYSRSRRDNEITAPLNASSGISKVEDLPIAFASPHSFDNPNKQHVFHY